MTTTTTGRALSVATTTVLLIAAGCDVGGVDFCGSNPTHEEQQPSCAAGGSARIQGPARLGLPEKVANVYGATCLDPSGGCSTQPFATFDSGPSEGHPRLLVQVFLPRGEGAATYTLPPPATDGTLDRQPYGNATLWTAGDGVPEDLEIAAGTITVTRSSPDDLRASFALTLRVPSTGETIALSSTDAAADCHLQTVTVCDGPALISPY